MKIQDISVAHTTTRPGHFADEAIPEIAFLGRSNVGKSSLINSLTQRRKLARTSKSPGRTQAIRCFEMQLLDHSGFGPELYQCVECRNSLTPGRHRFSPNLGGTLCLDCNPTDARLRQPPLP